MGNKILYGYIKAGRPSIVLGPGRSNVALSVADTAKYWKMIQVFLMIDVKHFIITVPLSTQEYKWVLENSQGA